jgi:hypothetical protein
MSSPVQFFKSLWSKNVGGKVTILAGFLILAVCVVGLVYAISIGAGDEGFLKVNGKELKWDKMDLPVQCLFDPDRFGQKQIDMYNQARDLINSRVGTIIGICIPWSLSTPFPSKPVRDTILLHVGEAEPKVDEGTSVETPWSVHPGGQTQIWTYPKKTNIYGVKVFISKAYEDNLSVWVHELGHVLGLGHDRLRSSIMWPKIQDRPGKLSGKDVALLKKAYN